MHHRDVIGRRFRRRWLKLAAVAVLGLQLGAGASAVLHALTWSGSPVAHVEAPGNESCPGGHNHAACQICRSITAPAVPVAALRIPQPDGRPNAAPTVVPVVVARAPRTALGARGPPLA
jgi:hypothetical protein